MLEVLQVKGVQGGQQRETSELARQLQTAAHADLDVFRKTAKWPASSIELTVKVEGLDEPVTTKGLPHINSWRRCRSENSRPTRRRPRNPAN